MATHYRTQGFALKTENLRESDQLLTIFSKDFGKLKILGRAIRKIKSKLRAGVQLFTLSEIEFIQGRTYKTLTDAILLKNFPETKKDLRKLKIVYRMSEDLDSLIGGEETDEKIWNLLNETFSRLNDSQLTVYSLELLYYYWLWNLLSILGYGPEIYNCAVCQKKLVPEQLSWSGKEGGVICNDCSAKIKEPLSGIDPDTIKIIRLILEKDWSLLKKLKIDKTSQRKLEILSKRFLAYILNQIK